MKSILKSFFSPSLILAPIVFFFWYVMDSLTYHDENINAEAWSHQFMDTIAFLLVFVSLLVYILNKYLRENGLNKFIPLVQIAWFLIVISALLVYIFAH